MRVLLSAFECNPMFGSDPYVGWSWVSNTAKTNEVYVLLRIDHKPYIEKYCAENKIEGYKNIHFIYLPSSELFGKIVYKFNKQLAVVGQYYMWQKAAYKEAKKLHATKQFDVAHVISIADFRFPGYLWKLNIPFIFGPVGGAQETPKCLIDYIKGHEKNEKFRAWMNKLLIMLPNYKKALSHADLIYCSNAETEEVIRKKVKYADQDKVYRLTELGINDDYLREREKLLHDNSKEIHILVSGRLIYRKGIELLLDSVNHIETSRPYIVDIYGEGDQKQFLKNKVRAYKLENRVFFHGNIPFAEMQEQYKKADVYCLPSLRETTGTAVFEAMANKLPIIALNQNGVKDIVQNDCGILVNVCSKEQVMVDLATALRTLVENDSMRQAMGENAFRKIKKYYTWSQRVCAMNEVYRELVNNYEKKI